jgi:hypothetical protein
MPERTSLAMRPRGTCFLPVARESETISLASRLQVFTS